MPAEHAKLINERFPSRVSRVGLLTGTALALAFAYLIGVTVQFGQIVAATYLNADAASAPVIGQLYGGSPAHRDVVLGQMAWFSTLMFELATRWLPFHRQIWEAAPYAMALAAAALIVWALRCVAGRWAAAVGGALVLCAAPHTLELLFSLNDHSPTWFSLALLAAWIVFLERRDELPLRLWLALPTLVIGVVVGANMASDTLLIGAGVVPFLLAAVTSYQLAPTRARLRSPVLVMATVLCAVVADVLTKLLMHHENVTIPAGTSHTGLTSGEGVVSNFKLWWQSIAVLGNGEFFGQGLGFTSGLEVVCAGLAIVAVAVLVPRVAWRELADAFRRTPPEGSDELAHPPATLPPLSTRSARLAWCVFWGTSAILLSLGFIVSSTPVDIESDRYLVGLIYAAAALVPVAGTYSAARRSAISAGAIVFAFTGLVGLVQARASSNPGKFPTDSASAQVAAIARQQHLKIGYAGYWDATPITWATHFAVDVYPVVSCGAQLCGSPLHYISSWYTPLPHTRTFLISDPTQPASATAVPALGKPSAVYTIDELTMYVYPYDIASQVHP